MNSTLEKQIRDVNKGVVIIDLIAAILIIFLSNSIKEMLTGLLFGSLIAVLNFRLLAISLQKSVTYAPTKAQIYSTSRYIIRMFIMAVVLYVSAVSPHISIIGTTIGLLSTKFSILGKRVVIDKLKRKEA
ncbi:ATP synthase protein I (ATP synthase F0 sector subunit I) [[Clostridium] sordellii]|uniref:ATP synthase protein I (ATP synthase F0 sector subunit I) n=1 Tax=Paraclostridium sordellii TaxID=1505 RepID=A0A0A1RVV0_PARSO|nr:MULTISPECIES: ATP synthase subunit I [Paeniclostridium]MDU7905445.1 ATP synthase subunit I [Peptostreptococcaceae bacterium]AUN12959.1 ATP synthase subunit I [Paeniclostridium sordellii]MBS6025072.1 ATP synthase subunit I [Paeniclostridium sordellii]MBW4863934.1 ATP synthase subunit I [Paeniclostridium sp.]MBW4874672.1 ATP synthase subunit I [Paeniclostridium sp.]